MTTHLPFERTDPTRRMTRLFAALALALLPASSSAFVINVDAGTGGSPYTGQGALTTTGNFWNNIGGGGPGALLDSQGNPVTNAQGDPVTVTFMAGATGPKPAITNDVLSDYQFVSYFFAPYTGMLSIEGLDGDEDYLLYVYAAGDQPGEGAAIELNGVTGLTNGTQLPTFVEDENYTVMEVKADSNGVISGTFEPFNSFSTGAINGLQITPTTIVARVLDFAGAESPTVHSPGDPITVIARFNEEVTLDQVGGLELDVDVDGTVVTATHLGPTLMGKELTLRVDALPSATTMQTKVVANSLRLTGGASLVDEDGIAVVLGHPETALPNDQVSATRFSVYPFVTGLAESEHYRFRVREVGSPTWSSAFAWFTECADDIPGETATNGYYGDQIGGWSHTYANFEMANNVPLEVEIQRLDPTSGTQIDIQSAVPRRERPSHRHDRPADPLRRRHRRTARHVRSESDPVRGGGHDQREREAHGFGVRQSVHSRQAVGR